MKRKILFLVFTDEACKQNHALMYALELHGAGHEVKIVLEGPGTGALRRSEDGESNFGKMFKEAQAKSLVAGACKRASGGCASTDESKKNADFAVSQRVPLLEDLNGHAGIQTFINDGYEVITF